MPKDDQAISPELLLQAYANGIFPMSDGGEDDPLFWVDPRERGIFPLNGFHISKSLAREIQKQRFEITINLDFCGVVTACANRKETWINAEIFRLYKELHETNFAHSVEVYEKDTLVGGVYGVTLGSAFFGESMFSKRENTSKIALAYLIDHLNRCGFQLFDTQFLTPHLASLGAIEISRRAYQARLEMALTCRADFLAYSLSDVSATGIIQRNAQTS